MDSNGTLIWLLALATLVIAVGVAIWQRKAAAKSKDEHHHSALTAGHPEQRKSDGSDPGTKPH